MTTTRPLTRSLWKPKDRAVYRPSETSGYDADAQSYITDLETAGATVSTTKKDAIDTWVTAGKSAGWWSKLIEVWFWTWGAAGPNAVGVLGSTGTFSGGGWTHNATEAHSNGSTDYFQMGSVPSTNGMALDSACLGVYSQDDIGAATCDIGALQTIAQTMYLYGDWSTDRAFFTVGHTDVTASGTIGTSIGLILGNRNGTTIEVLKKTSSGITVVNTGTIASAGSLPTIELFGSARNDSGSPIIPSTRKFSMMSVAKGMTEAERTSFANETYSLLGSLGVSVI